MIAMPTILALNMSLLPSKVPTFARILTVSSRLENSTMSTATMAQLLSSLHCPKLLPQTKLSEFPTNFFLSPLSTRHHQTPNTTITCSASNKSSPPPSEISSTAKIRSEVLTPFRSVRMFFYLAFIASGSLGGLIATTRLIGALSRNSPSMDTIEILKGLGIDLGAVLIFAFLYFQENKIKNAQIARLSREENLSNLKLRVDEKRTISVNALRGIARLVVVAGPGSYILEAFERSKPFTESLVERGVVVVPFATDGNLPKFEVEVSEEFNGGVGAKNKRLWQLVPVYASEWSRWLDEQKGLANVAPEAPVYISLRMDGRVRGSGVGYPPWNAFVAQLPPVKGLWSGLLDGMDGKV